MAEMLGYGYRQSDILPVSQLARVWKETCFLRFIRWADINSDDVVPQCYEEEPVIEWIG